METPSSLRRITRSQAKASMNNNNNNNITLSRKNEVHSRKRSVKIDRSALIDITNDSPICGLAMGSLETPSSLVKKRSQPKQTPGSGEALLREQVKNLLQKVEEEGGEVVKLSFKKGPFLGLNGIVNSPSGFLAPTPTNTPQFEVIEESEIHQEEMMVDELKHQGSLESEKSDVTRALSFDFYEKSDFSECSSVLTQGSVCEEKSTEEDDASVWSVQVNTSTRDEDEEEEIEEEDYNEEEEADYEEHDGEEGGLVDELCEGISKIFLQKKTLPDFEGKHIRFVYNSDGELKGEVVVNSVASPSVLRLKGMPVPEGKHLRFPEE
ncbi:hypothetical protein IFM89_005735 [Coptis chinensis]|uniref:Chalcone-flavanone isomerase family protein n=1 Tax=Coptis chinensis TaxID=261450 RepID=A0A835MCY3_9MAGN|nr:hypothetical protein IFM89_005735 [Coptis chinensis]